VNLPPATDDPRVVVALSGNSQAAFRAAPASVAMMVSMSAEEPRTSDAGTTPEGKPPPGSTSAEPPAGPPPTGPADPPPVGQSVPPPSGGPAGGGTSPPTPPTPPAGEPPQGLPTAAPTPAPGRGGAAVGLAMVAVALISGVTGAVTANALDDDPPRAPSPSESLSARVDRASEGPEATEPLAQAAEAVLPSVVSIAAESELGDSRGSGVLISSDGQILTNTPVVAGAGDDVTVTFSDGTTAGAETLGTDPASDLAVIQAEDVRGLTPARLGRSRDLVVGDSVLAIGSPLGLEGSVSAGIVSAVNRAIDLGPSPGGDGGGGGDEGGRGPFEEDRRRAEPPTSAVIDAVQTDAAINPGNSGGPLINTAGEVVGINTAIASPAAGLGDPTGAPVSGLGFAIPIDDARVIAEQLIEDGEATHAYMGVHISEATERGDGGDGGRGALVTNVERGSPADDAGLEDGDVITAVDGEPVRDPAALTARIRRHAPGDEVSLTVIRDGDETEVTVTLGTLPTGDS
jgi:putative serine protease PepD